MVDDGFTATELDAYDAVVTRAAVGIAETGTVVLDHQRDQGRRAITLVPDLHVCVVDAGQAELTVVAHEPTRAVLLGGTPYDESIVMWWNFIGRDHDEIVAFREAWQSRAERFGDVEGYAGRLDWLPAPELPAGRLRSRDRHGRH